MCLPIALVSGGCSDALAQDNPAQLNKYNSSVERQLKDVTATGPYPFYVTIQPLLFTIGNDDVHNTFKLYNEYRSPDLKIPRKAWGYNVEAGVRLFRTLIIEAGFTQTARKEDTEASELKFKQNTLNVRIGTSIGIYYPFSVQLGVGAVTSTTEFQIVEPGMTGTARRKIEFGDNIWKGRFGFDFIGRLVLMDPVGAGGGLGGYIEIRHFLFIEELDYTPYGRVFDPAHPGDLTSDSNFTTFSVGFIFPFALRSRLGHRPLGVR